MKEPSLDQKIREHLTREELCSTASYDEMFSRAMEQGRRVCEQEPKRWKRRGMRLAIVATFAVCAFFAARTFFQPSKDLQQGYQPKEAFLQKLPPLSQEQTVLAASPTIHVSAGVQGNTVTLKATLQNETNDIWLIAWEPLFKEQWGEGQTLRSPMQLIWMEPGTTCEDSAVWEGDFSSSVSYTWQGYRVSAKTLFWTDELVSPTDEEYTNQQQLLTDAFKAKALLIQPGYWENGEAGALALVLPEAYQDLHPNETPLQYALSAGLLEADEKARGIYSITVPSSHSSSVEEMQRRNPHEE